MSGDQTRFSFDPLKRYSGVLMQQGRVQLDSDWNEEIDILRRRLRTTALDTFGPVGVPYLSSPDAFEIGLIAGPPTDLSIAPGRLYVDGVQIEAFAEENFTYLNQKFLPAPLPAPLPAGDAVVFLDIWDREVTYIEDPELLDAALGGADTTTRVQTVWQLRVEERPGATCDLDVGEPPSAARLTTQAIAPPAPDDPCILPPASGYRGLENRLYRIEIHTGGPLGTAAFKWSRDNGTIVSSVRSIVVSATQTTLGVNRIGRDQFMRFRIGDWVTVTDDHRELMGEAGEMAVVADLDETNLRVVLDRVLPAGGGRPFGANDAEVVERHTRIQKWDQTAAANPGLDPVSGLIATGAGPIAIEAGIEVNFSVDPAGGSFRIGDYWVFWARTATAEIEILTAAPPRGIEHRYLQLAALSGIGGANPAVIDCRPPPPEQGQADCCCTIIVRPGEDIQAGIDALPDQGGCVCLKTGLHLVREPLRIMRGNIVLKAESPGTTVRSTGAGPVLIIGNAAGFRIEGIDILGIAFEANAPRQAVEGVVVVAGCAAVRFAHCAMRAPQSRLFIGISITASDRVTVSHCRIEAVLLGIFVQVRCEDFEADGNMIELGAGRGDDQLPAVAGIWLRQSAFPCRITGNFVEGALFGIVLNDNPLGSPASLADRSIVVDNLVDSPVLSPDLNSTVRLCGIDCAADACTISGNKIRHVHPLFTGIRVNGALAGITGNAVFSSLQQLDVRGPTAIRLGEADDANQKPILGGIVSHNVMVGTQHGIIMVGVDDLVVEGNVVEGSGQTGFALFGMRLRGSHLSGNNIRSALSGIFLSDGNQNRVAENHMHDGNAGISLFREWGPAVDRNRIDRLNLWGIIGLQLSARCEVTGNRIVACGRAMNPIARAINLFSVAGEAHITDNEIMDTGSLPGTAPTTTADYGIAGDLILEARVSNNLVTYSNAFGRDPAREDRALIMRGLFDFQPTDSLVLGFAIQIQGNKFIGTGQTALVELLQAQIGNGFARFERVSFDHNYLMHVSPPTPPATPAPLQRATVFLRGRSAIVMGNHIKAITPGHFSVNFNGMPGPYIGNITAGPTLQHVDFPAPANAFNMLAP
jgi:parallel beta-helix repeat protein